MAKPMCEIVQLTDTVTTKKVFVNVSAVSHIHADVTATYQVHMLDGATFNLDEINFQILKLAFEAQ